MTCMLITLAMQLTCTFDNKLACTDNESLAQLLYVPSCQTLMLEIIPIELAPSYGLNRAQPSPREFLVKIR
jgi:hypothetical protein